MIEYVASALVVFFAAPATVIERSALQRIGHEHEHTWKRRRKKRFDDAMHLFFLFDFSFFLFKITRPHDAFTVSLQCPWLVRCCPARSHKQRRQDRVCPPLPTPGVTIYRSDGACRGQGTIAETLAGWSAAVWSADARGLGAGFAFTAARGFLGNDYSNNQTEYFCSSSMFVPRAAPAGLSRYF